MSTGFPFEVLTNVFNKKALRRKRILQANSEREVTIIIAMITTNNFKSDIYST